uniref:Uncharacterized protein n=1 Tax=Oryza sativa subsp. japonica TaxID=39947 RepID=Q7XHL6_ORYSJ|nr:hypothetical protein [Oryza sativa Japonica Group]
MRLLRRRMGHTEGSASMDGARSSFAIFPLPFSASLVDAVEAANGPSSWSSASWSSNHVHRRTQRKLGQPAMETVSSAVDGGGGGRAHRPWLTAAACSLLCSPREKQRRREKKS